MTRITHLKRFVLAALASLTLSAGMTSAQENYTIRPTYPSNLRIEPSLQAEVFELIGPGIPVLVIGESGDWLEIRRFHETVYMANWIPYAVVGHGDTLTVASDFADMSCTTDPGLRRSGGITTFSFHQGCQVTRIKQLDFGWTESEPDDEAENDTPIDHEGHLEFDGLEAVIEKVKEALDELYAISPNWYAYVVDVVDKIVGFEEKPGDPHFNQNAAAYVYPHNGSMYVGDYVALQGFGTRELSIGLASVLVHEACHVHQYLDKLSLKQPDREIMCMVVQLHLIDGLRAPEVKGHIEGKIIIDLYDDGR